MTTLDAAVAPPHPRLATLSRLARALHADVSACAATSGYVAPEDIGRCAVLHGWMAALELEAAGLLVFGTGGTYVHAPEVLDRAAALERGDVP